MPLPIQLGELANRVRRALDVRGRLPLALDETVVPVVLIGDADELPYALEPMHAAGYQDVTGQAGNLSTIGISNQGPEGSVFVLEQLTIWAGTAGTRVEVSRSGVLQSAVAALSTRVMADTSSQARPGTTGRDIPVRMSAWDLDIVTVGSICEIVGAPQITSLVLPVKHMLRAGEVCYVKTLSDAIRLIVGASGRFFPSLSDTGA